MARIVVERAFGLETGRRLKFSAREVRVLKAAELIAAKARELELVDDVDDLLAEIQHSCHELTEDAAGRQL